MQSNAEQILDEFNMDPDRTRTYLRYRPGHNNAEVADKMGISRQSVNEHYKNKFRKMSDAQVAILLEWSGFRDLEEMDVERQVVAGDDGEE